MLGTGKYLNSFAGASEIKLFLHNAGVQAIKLF
jgi:hypothetical protein